MGLHAPSRHTPSPALRSREKITWCPFPGFLAWLMRAGQSRPLQREERSPTSDGGAEPGAGQRTLTDPRSVTVHRAQCRVPGPPVKRKPNWYSRTINSPFGSGEKLHSKIYSRNSQGSGPLGRLTAESSCHHLPGRVCLLTSREKKKKTHTSAATAQ